MMKEDDDARINATGGLGSEKDNRTWTERVHSMQDPASETECLAPEDERTEKDLVVQSLIWGIRFAAVCSITIAMFRLWEDDEIRLHLLHAITQILQAIARMIGMWALEFEQAYNEFADSLH